MPRLCADQRPVRQVPLFHNCHRLVKSAAGAACTWERLKPAKMLVFCADGKPLVSRQDLLVEVKTPAAWLAAGASGPYDAPSISYEPVEKPSRPGGIGVRIPATSHLGLMQWTNDFRTGSEILNTVSNSSKTFLGKTGSSIRVIKNAPDRSHQSTLCRKCGSRYRILWKM